MLRLLIDENFNQRILRGLHRRLSSLDVLLAEQAGLRRAKDPVVLAWAARENRTILTHDEKTMVPDAKQLVLQGRSMAGLILVPQRMDIGRAINDLEILIVCLDHADLRDQIKRLPLLETKESKAVTSEIMDQIHLKTLQLLTTPAEHFARIRST